MRVKGKSKYNTYFKLGDQYSNWTVSGPVIMEGEAKVEVTCKCGYTANVSAYAISKGSSKGCLKCNQVSRHGKGNSGWKGFGEVPGSFTQRYKLKEKKGSKYKWETTEEEINEIYLAQDRKCALSGLPISFKKQNKNWIGFSCTASLDRIDSTKGYIKGNIQLVHKDINIMKNTHSVEYFQELCKAVVSKID